MAGQAVVGDGLPGRRVRDVLAVRRPDAGVGVEGAHAHADDVVVVGVAAEEGGPAGGAEGLLEAVGGRVHSDELLSARDVERAGRDAGADRGGAAGAALAAGAVAVAGVLGRGRELVADTPAHAAAGEGEGHAARVPRAGGESPSLWSSPRMEALDELAGALRARLVERARSGEAGAGGLESEGRELVEREAAPLPEAGRGALRERVMLLATGLGPFEPLLADPAVDEVMVNGPASVYVERGGRVERVGVEFAGEAELMHAIERVLAPLGRRVDEAAPLCDARLADGSRVNVVIPPLSLSGPCITIRRFRREGFSLRDLVERGTLPPSVAELLAVCVAARASILVSGGTGSGKTTTLNALSGAIPGEERIVTVEDAAELRLRQRHVVRLEARPPNLEGRGEVTIRQLVRNALRMRPDRIVVGEVRGAEALDMLSAMSTGHDGSLSTVHAGSPEEALRRVETLALMAGLGLPHAAVREQVAGALDLVVHQVREPGGSRAVESVTQVVRVAGGAGTRELYRRGGEL